MVSQVSGLILQECRLTQIRRFDQTIDGLLGMAKRSPKYLYKILACALFIIFYH